MRAYRRITLLIIPLLLSACMAAPAGYFGLEATPAPESLAPEALLVMLGEALAARDAEEAAAAYAACPEDARDMLDALLVAEADACVEAVRAGGDAAEQVAWLTAMSAAAHVNIDPHINKLKQAQGSREAFDTTRVLYEGGAYLDALENASHVLRGWGYDAEIEALVDMTSDALASQMAGEAMTLRAQGEYEQAMYRVMDAHNFYENDATRTAYDACMEPPPLYLGNTTREDYHYYIEWEPRVFDEDRPLEYLRVKTLPEDKRARMEALIERFALLYPPDYFNTRVDYIMCYQSFASARLDEDDQPMTDASGSLIFDTFVGATGEGHIIITPNFGSDTEVLEALVHEFGHVQYHYDNGDLFHKDDYAQAMAAVNGEGFIYYYDIEGIENTGDISGWRSTNNAGDWNNGFARRYGMLSMDEDHSTLMEKMQFGYMPRYSAYPALYEKMLATVRLMAQEHPAFTLEFFTEELPAYWGR